MEQRLGDLYAEFDRVVPFLRGTTADRLCSIFAIHYEFETRRVKLFLAHIAASYSPSQSIRASRLRPQRASDPDAARGAGRGRSPGRVRADLDQDLAIDILKALYAWNYRTAACAGRAAARCRPPWTVRSWPSPRGGAPADPLTQARRARLETHPIM
jgi:hypothetical protein